MNSYKNYPSLGGSRSATNSRNFAKISGDHRGSGVGDSWRSASRYNHDEGVSGCSDSNSHASRSGGGENLPVEEKKNESPQWVKDYACTKRDEGARSSAEQSSSSDEDYDSGSGCGSDSEDEGGIYDR